MTKAPSVSRMWDGAALFFALRMICAAAAGRNALNVKLRGGAQRLRYAARAERLGGCGVARGGCDMRRLMRDGCACGRGRGDCGMRRLMRDGCGCGAARGDCNWRRVKDEWWLREGRGDCDMRRVRKDGAIAGRLAACGERWMAVVGQCLPLKCKKHIRGKQAATAVCGG